MHATFEWWDNLKTCLCCVMSFSFYLYQYWFPIHYYCIYFFFYQVSFQQYMYMHKRTKSSLSHLIISLPYTSSLSFAATGTAAAVGDRVLGAFSNLFTWTFFGSLLPVKRKGNKRRTKLCTHSLQVY